MSTRRDDSPDDSPRGPIRRLIDRITRERDEVRRTLRVTRLSLRNIGRSQLPRMAAALSYRTIFAIIPVLVVSVVVLQRFVSPDELRPRLEQLLNYAGFDTIAVDGVDAAVDTASGPPRSAQLGPADPADPAAGGPVDALGVGAIENSFGSVRLDELLAQIVEQASTIPISAIGFVGLLVLVYAAISMLVELERSFNQLYHAPTGRSWTRRIAIYWTTLTLGLIMLFAAFSVGQRIASGFDWGPLSDFAGLGASLVINTGLFLLAYTTIPNARVHVRAALAGAAVAAVAWEAAKWGFTGYVGFSTNLERIYGVIALLPLFLVWVYLTWVIVLFGLQIAYALQHFQAWIASAELDGGPRLIDPAAALPVAVVVAERFAQGDSTNAEQACNRTGIDGVSAAALLEALAERGFLRAAPEDADQRDEGFVLARPAELVSASRVLAVGEALCGSEHLANGGPVLAQLVKARRALLGGMSLRDLLDDASEGSPHARSERMEGHLGLDAG